MTQLESARSGITTDEMIKAAEGESLTPEEIRDGIAEGTIVLCSSSRRPPVRLVPIGHGLRTKVNANIGTSRDLVNLDDEIAKVRAAVEAGADTLMDLSTGGDIDGIRKAIIEASDIPVGTVPIYQAAVETIEKRDHAINQMDPEDLFDVIERQAADGVSFMTVHCGVTRQALERLEREGRIMDVVSRGGSFLLEWIRANDRENPLYEHFDRLVTIARKYDVILSLGDGLRPGCIADATDRCQIQELLCLGELTQTALDSGVQVMIEGPGHVPMDQVETNVLLEKRLCHGAPFYVLGPLVTDICPGYDHITGAIGGAMAAAAGADFLCYVTPSEHLGLPRVKDVREGVIASKIAAHAGDIAKRIPGAADRDLEMARSRKKMDWERQIELSLDPVKAREFRKDRPASDGDVCSMCSEYCAIKIQTK